MSAPERTPSPPLVDARPESPAGRYLTLVGVTPDGRRLRLADPHDPAGGEFTVEIDARLRAALGVQPATRPDQPVPKVETQMDSMLRPRDIQARIRAGETPESVAAAAKTTVEKVMPYAAPVLAEREHVAERAQRSSIRRPASETPHGARTLGEAVTGHLHERNVDPEVVAWDAWRREDGRWALTGRFSIQGREGLAELTFDQPGNFVVLDNDDARWLVGDLPDPAAEPEPELEGQPGVRRLASVPAEDEHQLSLTTSSCGRSASPTSRSRPSSTTSPASTRASWSTRLPTRSRSTTTDEDGDASHPSRRAARSRRPAAALRCRAGTRSCSVAPLSE